MTYRLSSLLAWRNRKVDLADADDWLDLLDDFGSALLRFLVDERYAAFVPDSEGMLSSLKVSLSKSPLSTLKCTRGSVWILFAYKEGLRGLPQPFRQEGLLLPFEWTREDRPQTGVPHGLAELSERVKEQFGAVGEPWHLVLPEYFAGHVDLDLEGSTYESAWGALASGLFLALHPRARFVAWPYSSIAFDFVRGEPNGVGELSAKILLASSMGAEEVAVAPSQQIEARRELAKLRARHPEDRNLRRLKIFRWKWTGEVPSSVKSLVRSNQRLWSPWKKVLAVNAMLLAVAIGIFATVRWNECREVREYYEGARSGRFGMPVGIGRLSESAVRQRNGGTCLTYRGYVTGPDGKRKRRLREMFDVDGSLRPVNAAKSIFLLNADTGELEIVRSYGTNGVLQTEMDWRFSASRRAAVTAYDENGNRRDIQVDDGRKAERYEVGLSDVGEVEQAVYRFHDGSFQERFFEDGGRTVRMINRDASGAFVRDEKGVAVQVDRHDKRGVLVESLFYDGTMNLANSYQGVAGYTNVVDVCGRVVETRYFGEDGLPCESYQGFAIERFSYDGFGRIAQVAWFDRFGRPTFNCEGVHGEKRTYGDDKGRLTQCEQLTIDGCYGAANASGFAKATYEYDDGMRTTRLRIWDRQDTPCCYPAAAWSEVIQKTDERGRVVESEYRGVTGSLTNGPHGGASRERIVRFDASGRPEEVEYDDCQGRLGAEMTIGPLLCPMRVERIFQKHDCDMAGRVSCKHVIGKVDQARYGISSFRTIQTRGGDVLEVQLLDAAGRLSDSRIFGFAKIAYKYNEQGDLYEAVCLKADGTPGRMTNGISRITRNVVRRSDGIAETWRHYNAEERLVDVRSLGAPVVRKTYDRSYWLRKVECLGPDGSPLCGRVGHWQRFEVAFDNENGVSDVTMNGDGKEHKMRFIGKGLNLRETTETHTEASQNPEFRRLVDQAKGFCRQRFSRATF